MMKVRDAISKIKIILIPTKPLPVEETSAQEFLSVCGSATRLMTQHTGSSLVGVFRVAVVANADFGIKEIRDAAPKGKHWAYFRMNSDGTGELLVSHPALLYAYTTRLVEEWASQSVSDFESGKFFTAAFKWHRPLFDYLLTQTWRTARNFDPEEHIRELARAGYTHLEVNGLAMPVPFERAIPGEFYSQFYSYCIGLDQYVYSELNKGIYPTDYLTANLNLLKKYARLGRKYGLEPGILCFEPRTVPEKLLERYPTLRGARADHPFRSRLPRYTLTIAHPRVRDHYTELVQKLLQEVPDLAYMSIWSNDSGAGFEYTSSLYVGRNGGPYLIREWRTHEQIAEVAGKNIVHFLKTLRNAASEINPEFRVSLRLEPFKVEHDVIMDNLEERLDIEVPSLLVRGYDLPYHHDKYPDISGVAGSVHHIHMENQEKELIAEHQTRGVRSHLIYSHGNGYNFEPLVGVPYPWMLHQKLKAMSDCDVECAANLGGFTPSRLAPYHINQEVVRVYMLDPTMAVDEFIRLKATGWVNESSSDRLVEVWRLADQTIRWLAPLPLYSVFGFVWLRVWVRPIIPDLHAIPESDRRYYEDYMVSTTNNTNLVDLGRDVLFELITQEYGKSFVERVDENVESPLNAAITLAEENAGDESLPEKSREVFIDLRDRLRALRCWVRTLRSVAAWVAGVYGYLGTEDEAQKEAWRDYLDDMMTRDIRNTRDLLELWESSRVNFMVVSKSGETSYIYGENLGELLRRKIQLVEEYRHVEPRIDPDIMWRV
ncbi:hypothetical protein MJD09_12950 [bacterium]|nr:hypothetical protein [bacterium]